MLIMGVLIPHSAPAWFFRELKKFTVNGVHHNVVGLRNKGFVNYDIKLISA